MIDSLLSISFSSGVKDIWDNDYFDYERKYTFEPVTGVVDIERNDAVDIPGTDLSTSTSSKTNYLHSIKYFSMLSISFEHPISRYIQFSIDADCDFSIMDDWTRSKLRYDDDNSNIHSGTEKKHWNTGAYQRVSLAFYPNTRTMMKISESTRYQRAYDYYDLFEFSGDDSTTYSSSPNDKRTLDISLDGVIEYYFSPKLLAKITLRGKVSNDYESVSQLPWYTGATVQNETLDIDYALHAELTWKLF